jgi:hypothetical protein
MPADTRGAEATFPGSVTIEGVVCYMREDQPGTWWYVPGDPVPELTGGRPSIQLWVSPPNGILQLGVDWTVPGDLLARVHQALAQAEGPSVNLQPAPATVRQVTVEIGTNRESREVVASSTSSGFPPYRAVFRVDLDAARANAAQGAINGRRGMVAVRYRVAAPLRASARVRLEGDVEPALGELPGAATPAGVRAWVDEAVAAGRLAMTRERSGPADDALEERARGLCTEKFTMLLDQAVRSRHAAGGSTRPAGSSRTMLAADATVSEIVQQEFERLTDVSTWLPPGTGAGHITVLPGRGGPDPAPPRGRVTVGLGFPAADLPLAFVEARCGEQKGVLRAPGFDPVAIEAAGCDDGLIVTSHFTTGSQPFRTQVAAGDAERLPPAALGLTEIVVDGRERRQAGAREIRVHLQFRPAGSAPAEDRTFYLRDDTWVGSFFVVTRGAPIAGECRLDWKETTRDGRSRRHRLTVNDQAVFVLREAEPDPGANS